VNGCLDDRDGYFGEEAGEICERLVPGNSDRSDLVAGLAIECLALDVRISIFVYPVLHQEIESRETCKG
jgi:hypothetical protein